MSAIQQAMLAVMRDAAEVGIGKDDKNEHQKYRYRGIERAMNTMVGILIRNKVLVLPSYETIMEKDLPTQKGGSAEYVKVRGKFRFMSAEDGSTVETEYFGEAMDSGDKATTKAQSVAFRTALFQTFVIPTMAIDPEEDDGQAEVVSPETQALLNEAQAAAETGMTAYKAFWERISKEQRTAIGAEHEAFKKIAAMADEQVPA
ncbi:ERF family protein [Castellaniella denitrificans]|uniref:ERF family protein n=1 Tax=Castellaniella denitrificans TaxID=56119 RepID=A0ABT4M6V4_9BURK|nr:ERF family protein [Castellaniella denitrificans]MCZ4331060.1 ERF family protein [Castellaniella denitrificans]